MRFKLSDNGDFGAPELDVTTNLEQVQEMNQTLVDPNGVELDSKVVNGTLTISEKIKNVSLFKNKLKFGDQGIEVEAIQKKLDDLHYYTHKIDGVFGFNTMIAVKSFQKANNRTPNGLVDAGTFNLIFNPPFNVQVANVEEETKQNSKKKLIVGGVVAAGIVYYMNR